MPIELDPKLGPLALLTGTWEGDKGTDVAPSDDRGTATSRFRERFVFEPTGRVDNHEQVLYGHAYVREVWRLSTGARFHHETGFFLWDADAKQVFRSLVIPRGQSVLAGGTVQAGDGAFTVVAEVGSATFGIVSNPFLDREFRTVRFTSKLTVLGPDRWRYDEDTELAMKGRADVFHHVDGNELVRVAG